MNAHRSILDRRSCVPGVAAVGAAMTDQLVQIVAELRHLAKAGTIPALYVDAGVIRVPWPAGQAIPTQFRRISIEQAEQLIAGKSLDHVFSHKYHRPGPKPKRQPPARESWQYLTRRSA